MGKSKRGAAKALRHLRIYRSMMLTPAWASLTPAERAVLLELYALHNGSNNGEIFLSLREAGRRCNINKDTAGAAFKVLEEKGFIRQRAKEPTCWQERYARCWILTEYPFPEGVAPSRDWQRWRPDTENPVP